MAGHDLRAVAFPTLNEAQIEKLGSCAGAFLKKYPNGQTLFKVGERDFKFFVVKSGEVEIIDESGDTPKTVTVHRPGEFTGDVAQLTGSPAVVSAIARGDTEVYEMSAESVRQFLNTCPDLADIILQAYLRRRFPGVLVWVPTGRGQHDALDALAVGITRTKVSWIVDAAIAGFFDAVSHEWLMRFVEHRIGDRRISRIVRKWLKAGVMEEGKLVSAQAGTPQGAVASPLLANIYLHYVFDLWADRWRKRHARGRVIIVRFADDIIIGFEHEGEARRFLADMRQRMEKFALSLHPDKTRLIEFGRYAAQHRARRGLGKPETFLPWVYSYLWAIQSRRLSAQAADASRSDANQTESH